MLTLGGVIRQGWRLEMSEREEAKEDAAEDLDLEKSESDQVAGGLGDIKGESSDDKHKDW
jgi:hypothetical protein